jgi:hypothetical protein
MEDKQLKEAIASLAKDKGQRDALAQMFVEYIQPNHIAVDFVGMLLNSRSLREGDSLVKKIRKGLEVKTLVPGSIHLKGEITISERANYILDGADIGVTYNEWELESGEIGSVDEIRAEMLAKLRDYYQQKVFTALTQIWTAVNTPSNFVSAGGAISDTVLKAAIDYINETTSGVKAVVGVRSALTPITEFGAFWKDDFSAVSPTVTGVDSQLLEVMRTGWLGTYYGAPIVAVNQTWDNPEDHVTLIPTDKILVIGENVGEFITYGDVKYKEWEDPRPTPPQWNLEFYQRFGLMIWKAEGIYVIGGIS